MNTKKLKAAEKHFLNEYPGGFQNEEMMLLGKKHKMDSIVKFARVSFSKDKFKDEDFIKASMIKLVNRSSMVSIFEKPKFRDAINQMRVEDKNILINGLNELLHGDEQSGFEMMLEILTYYKLAKWTIITVFRCYYFPDTDLLYKPTTVKNVINFFELDDIKYSPRPSYDFFVKYRKYINEMKDMVDKSLSPNNAAFSGFLMMEMN